MCRRLYRVIELDDPNRLGPQNKIAQAFQRDDVQDKVIQPIWD